MDLLFSTALNTDIAMCCISADTAPDQESLVIFTISCAPFRTNSRQRYPKTSSKQIGVENLTPKASKTVYSSPFFQKW